MEFIRKTKGAVSIFLVIILLPMITVAGIMVDASRIKLGKAMAETAGDLTLNTALTNYDTVLKDVYGLFAMSQNEDELMENLEEYFTRTITTSGVPSNMAAEYSSEIVEALRSTYLTGTGEANFDDLMNIKVLDFSATPVSNSSLANPGVMKKQMVEFMKYRGPVSMGMSFFDSLSAFDGLTEKKKVIDAKMKYYEKQADLAEACKKLYDAIKEFETANEKMKVSTVMSEMNEVYNIYKNNITLNLLRDLYINNPELSKPLVTVSEDDEKGYVITSSVLSVEPTQLSLKDARSNLDNAIEYYNNSHIVADLTRESDFSKYYGPQYLRKYNSQDGNNLGYAVMVTNIYKLFKNYSDKCLDPNNKDEEEKAQYSSVQRKYNAIMKEAVTVSNNAQAAYDQCHNTISGIKDTFNKGLQQVLVIVKNIEDNYKKCKDALDKASAAAANVKTKIIELQSAQNGFKQSLQQEGLPNDTFKQSAEAEYNEMSQIFKVSDVELIETRINEAKNKLDTIKGQVDKYKYGNYPVKDITNLNTVRSAVSGITFSHPYQNYSMSYPPVTVGGLNQLSVRIFNMQFSQPDWPSTITDASIGYPPTPRFYTYLEKTYSGTEDDKKKDEVKEARDSLLSKSKDNLDKVLDPKSSADSSDTKQSIVFSDRNLNEKPEGYTGEWKLPSSESRSAVSTGQVSIPDKNDSKDLKNDKAKKALDDNSGFLDSLSSTLKQAMIDGRDNLYATEYMMKMFSHNAYYNELRYQVEKDAGRSLSYASIIAKANDSDEVLAKAKTLTNVEINKENNYAFGGEIEYLIFGNTDISTNIGYAYGSIFAIRFTLNTIYAFTSPQIRSDAHIIAFPISAATFGLFPEPLVQAIVIIGFSLAETSLDLVYLKQGMPVPIYKNKDTWKVSTTGLLNEVKNVAVDVGTELANQAIDKAATKLQDFLDKTDEELKNLTEQEIKNLKDNLNTTINSIFEEAAGTVINKVTESCNAVVADIQAGLITAEAAVDKVEEELRKYVGEDVGSDLIKEAKEAAYNYIIEKEFIKELIDILSNKSAMLTAEGVNKLNEKVKRLRDDTINFIMNKLKTAGDKLNEYREKAKNYISEGIDKGKEELKKRLSEQLGKLGDAGKTNAGSSASSLLSFQYSDYLRLFLFIAVSTSDGPYKRTADLIQCNVAHSSNFNHDSKATFDMAKAYTYLNIKAEVEIKPIVISVPLIANQIKDPTTNNNWYLYEYEGTAGY